MNPIGIMQGRLSPPVDGRIQSFPVDTWREEFEFARQAGLACIEWIYETGTDARNPLRTDEGIAEILRLSERLGVASRSICADYFMSELLVESGGEVRAPAVAHLRWLLGRAETMGVRYIVLPFVDSSSLKSPQEIGGLASALSEVLPEAERTRIELHLETDLPPKELVAILESIGHPLVRANYDIGNSAALGHEPSQELSLIGPWLGSVHVKDRIKGGHTVPLGSGNADFDTCFRLIAAAEFTGAFILQAARENGLSETELAKRNRMFVERHLLALTPA